MENPFLHNPQETPLFETKTLHEFENEHEFYRVIVGDDAFLDIVKSGVVKTNEKTKPVADGISLEHRPTAFPSFSKGKVSIDYTVKNPNHYIVVTEDGSMQASKSGRHGKGTTFFPTNEEGAHLKELSADKVRVYKHLADGSYSLVYANGVVL